MATKKESTMPKKRAKRFAFPDFPDHPPTYEEYRELMDEYTARARDDNEYVYLLNKFFEREYNRIYFSHVYDRAYAKSKITPDEQYLILERAHERALD